MKELGIQKSIDSDTIFVGILALCLRNRALQIQLKPFLYPRQSCPHIPSFPRDNMCLRFTYVNNYSFNSFTFTDV